MEQAIPMNDLAGDSTDATPDGEPVRNQPAREYATVNEPMSSEPTTRNDPANQEPTSTEPTTSKSTSKSTSNASTGNEITTNESTGIRPIREETIIVRSASNEPDVSPALHPARTSSQQPNSDAAAATADRPAALVNNVQAAGTGDSAPAGIETISQGPTDTAPTPAPETQTNTQTAANRAAVPLPDAQANDQNAADAENMSLDDILKKYIPEDCILMDSIKQRQTKPWVKGDHSDVIHFGAFHHQLNTEFADEMEVAIGSCRWNKSPNGHPEYTVIVIEDINLQWCRLLTKWYPSLDQVFLAQHVLRFDELLTEEAYRSFQAQLRELCPDSMIRWRVEDAWSCSSIELPVAPKEISCVHIDTDSDAIFKVAAINLFEDLFDFRAGVFSAKNFRKEDFIKAGGDKWYKPSIRLSCCRLDNNLYLALVDGPVATPAKYNVHPFQGADLPLPRAAMLKHGCLYDLANIRERQNLHTTADVSKNLQVLMHYHTVQSVFDPQAAPLRPYSPSKLRQKIFGTTSNVAELLEPGSNDQRDHRHDTIKGTYYGGISVQNIVLLLQVSFYQFELTRMEANMKQLKFYAMKEIGDLSFPRLIRFRSQLAYIQDFISAFRETISTGIRPRQWYVQGRGIVDSQTFWSTEKKTDGPMTPIPPHYHPQTVEARRIEDLIAEIESAFAAMSRPLYEEIQIVIGAVQIEDAKTMKRQTEWTVVLGILAAIYLPMTLVTGIFGMNIKELSNADTAPDRWSTVKAWGITFGATVGSILLYASTRTFLLPALRIGHMLFWRHVKRLNRSLKRRLYYLGSMGRIGWSFLSFLIACRDGSRKLHTWLSERASKLRKKWRQWDEEAQDVKMD